MDLNENLLINNKQARARSCLLFPRYPSLLLLFPSLSGLLVFRELHKDGKTEGMGPKQAPNMKMDVVRGAAVTWQAFHQTSSCTSWRRERRPARLRHLVPRKKISFGVLGCDARIS